MNIPDPKNLSGLHLFHAKTSNCSMRARFMLAEKKLNYKSHILNIQAQENLNPDYLKIHPDGLVPALVHDGLITDGSDSILLYLEHKFPKPSFTPNNDDQCSVMIDWVRRAADFQLLAVKPFTYGILGRVDKSGIDFKAYKQAVGNPDIANFHERTLDGLSENEIQKAKGIIEDTYAVINGRLAKPTYLCGANFTLADIAWSTPHISLERAGFDVSLYPNVSEWINRLKQRPAYLKAIQTH